MYNTGEGVALDYKEGVKMALRLSAAQGDAGGEYNLAGAYFFGNGVPRDYEIAAMWYEKSAEQGRVDAADWLASMYGGGTEAFSATISPPYAGIRSPPTPATRSANTASASHALNGWGVTANRSQASYLVPMEIGRTKTMSRPNYWVELQFAWLAAAWIRRPWPNP